MEHFKSIHAQENFKCHEYKQTVTSEESLKVHVENEHKKCLLNATFFNPSASQ